ncbi:hypothetical protein GW17_00003661 [Ensete ventricosum]|nr:hypothetical protein GW17_00003661 [Ensete ventricosum]
MKQLLLGYLPAEKDLWEGELANNRLRYAELKRELLLNPVSAYGRFSFSISQSEFLIEEDETSNSSRVGRDNEAGGLLCRREISNGDHPLCLGNGSVWNQYFKVI